MPYSRASRRLRKFLRSYKHTKTFGSYLPLRPFGPQKIYYHFLSALLTKLHHKGYHPAATANARIIQRLNQKIFHLLDEVPEQRDRDDAMRAVLMSCRT